MSKKYEGVKELIGLVVLLGTGATLSVVFEDGCTPRGVVEVHTLVAGEVWVNETRVSDGVQPADTTVRYKAPRGQRTFTLRSGDAILSTRVTHVLTKRETQVWLGDEPLVDPRDGRSYPTARLAGLRWMSEDLAYAAAGSRCYGEEEPGCTLSRVYTWEQAMSACPPGWRLPTMPEWERLAGQFGGCEGCAVHDDPTQAAKYLHTIDEVGVGLRMGGQCTIGADASMSCFNRAGQGGSGIGYYWSGGQDGDVLSVWGEPGGVGERSMTDEERSRAKDREKQLPTPSTTNERRKAHERLNAKVVDSYGATAALRKMPLHHKSSLISVRCVAD